MCGCVWQLILSCCTFKVQILSWSVGMINQWLVWACSLSSRSRQLQPWNDSEVCPPLFRKEKTIVLPKLNRKGKCDAFLFSRSCGLADRHFHFRFHWVKKSPKCVCDHPIKSLFLSCFFGYFHISHVVTVNSRSRDCGQAANWAAVTEM